MTCRHDDGPHHDCDYVEVRNHLIPLAEARANLFVGPDDDSFAWSWRWDHAFHVAMAELTVGL